MRPWFKSLFSAVLLACAVQAHTQVVEPTYSNQYNVIEEAHLVPLERATGVAQTESHSFLVITPNSKTYQSFPGPSSPVRVGPGAHFVLRMAAGDVDPSTLIKLHKLISTKKDRELVAITVKGSLLPMLGPKIKNNRNDALPVRAQKYGDHSYEIIPEQPLEPGEYGFGYGNELQCFGVDAAGASTGTRSPVQTPVQAAVPVHRAPKHPKSTDRDLPPAAAGLLPMHADSDAADGCWWAPYYSATLGLEFAYQQCPLDSSMGAHLTITERGDAVQSQTAIDTDAVAQLRKTAGEAAAQSYITSNTKELFKVRSKSATETLEAAVKQQIILHFKDPASRTGCVAKREVDSATQHVTVSIVAVGLYAKRKTHPLGLGGNECDGYSTTGDGEVTTEFWETTPAEPTHFLQITTTPDSSRFAPETIHFQSTAVSSSGASSAVAAPTSVDVGMARAGSVESRTLATGQSGVPREIVGIPLGTTVEAVKAKLGKSWNLIVLPNSFPDPEQQLYRAFKQVTTGENFSDQYVFETTAGRIIFIEHYVQFAQSERPNFEVMQAQLLERFGSPTSNDRGSNLLWINDRSERKVLPEAYARSAFEHCQQGFGFFYMPLGSAASNLQYTTGASPACGTELRIGLIHDQFVNAWLEILTDYAAFDEERKAYLQKQQRQKQEQVDRSKKVAVPM